MAGMDTVHALEVELSASRVFIQRQEPEGMRHHDDQAQLVFAGEGTVITINRLSADELLRLGIALKEYGHKMVAEHEGLGQP